MESLGLVLSLGRLVRRDYARFPTGLPHVMTSRRGRKDMRHVSIGMSLISSRSAKLSVEGRHGRPQSPRSPMIVTAMAALLSF